MCARMHICTHKHTHTLSLYAHITTIPTKTQSTWPCQVPVTPLNCFLFPSSRERQSPICDLSLVMNVPCSVTLLSGMRAQAVHLGVLLLLDSTVYPHGWLSSVQL